MISKLAKVSMVLALASAIAPLAAQAEESSGYVGIPLGVGFGSSGYGPRFIFGGEAGYKFMPEFGLGVFLDWSKKNGVAVLPFGLEANYFVPGVGAYIGANIGMAHESVDSTPLFAGGSSSNFMIGLQAGYDYMIVDNFTIGLKVVYDVAPSGSENYDAAGNDLGTTSALNMFKIAAAFRYWF